MTILIIYSIIVTGILGFIVYSKLFGKGRITSQELAKLEAENEVLKIQHNQDIQKLQEAFGGKVIVDDIDAIIDSESTDRKRHKRKYRKNN